MSKYTKSAKGQECQVRIPGICNHNPETVVFAHLNGGGMGMKRADIHGAYCCSACHDCVDGRVSVPAEIAMHLCINSETVHLYHLQGMVRTQEIMIKEGVLKL